MVFSEIVGTLSFLKPQADDDFVDRLHYYYTSTFLLITAVLISLKMFGGKPIECWVPAEYKSGWEDYTEMFCWARSTYWVPFDEEVPDEIDERDKNMISYYQWTPFFLAMCAFCFYCPCLLWRISYRRSGVQLNEIMTFASDGSNIQPNTRHANVKGLAAHLGSILRYRFTFGSHHPTLHRYMKLLNLRYYGSYLTMLYILIKVIYLCNCVGQLFLMNKFLQTDSSNIYGLQVISDLLNGRPWTESGYFPRITLCDLNVRILGNVQRHTVQCVLVINIFTEKVFILLWLWYSLLAFFTITSSLLLIWTCIPLWNRKRFISRRLELADINFNLKKFDSDVDKFVRDEVKMDGIFVLQMLNAHAGKLMCTEVVDAMWDNFLDKLGESVLDDLAMESVMRHPVHFRNSRDRFSVGQISHPEAYSPTNFDVKGYRRKMSILVPLLSMDYTTERMPYNSNPYRDEPTSVHDVVDETGSAPPQGNLGLLAMSHRMPKIIRRSLDVAAEVDEAVEEDNGNTTKDGRYESRYHAAPISGYRR
ncbi:hypothetical protein AB6A40_005114 [Gnathostoma spinigerum]|uniref:Innexin n=1 Tax=Gnathostoma spinigerum TaxID=75299 RepID=A0ABD6EQ62_9BILA